MQSIYHMMEVSFFLKLFVKSLNKIRKNNLMQQIIYIYNNPFLTVILNYSVFHLPPISQYSKNPHRQKYIMQIQMNTKCEQKTRSKRALV